MPRRSSLGRHRHYVRYGQFASFEALERFGTYVDRELLVCLGACHRLFRLRCALLGLLELRPEDRELRLQLASG